MNKLARLLQYIQQHKRSTVTIVVLCTIFGFGFNVFLNYTVIDLTITAPSSVQSGDIQAYASYSKESNPMSSLIHSSGLSIIPRDTTSLTVTTKNQQMRTITALNIPWYGVVSKHAILSTDKNADKIAFRSSLYNNCASYDAIDDRLLTFACYGNSGLTYYDTSTTAWMNNLITKIDINGPVAAYRGGVIGLSSVNDRDASSRSAPIEYISSNGTRHHYVFPDNFIEYNDFSQISIVTDSSDPSNSHFIVINEGILYLASIDAKDNISYVTVPAPSNYNSASNQTLCSFKGVDIYCYRGIIASDDTDSKTVNFKPTITKASFTNPSTQSLTTDVRIADSFYTTTDGQLFIKNYKSLFHLKEKNSSYVTEQISNSVDDAQADSELYFIDSTGIFIYNVTTETSSQVFRSANITPKHLVVSGGKTFVLGYAADDITLTYTYAWSLNNETDNAYGNRLIDKLPLFSVSGINDDVDLIGNKINITLRDDNSKVDDAIHQLKQTTFDYLKLRGINTGDVTLTNP